MSTTPPARIESPPLQSSIVAPRLQVDNGGEVWYTGRGTSDSPLTSARKCDIISRGTVNRDQSPLTSAGKYGMLGGEARNGGPVFAPLLLQSIINSPRMSRHSGAKYDMLVSHALTGGPGVPSPLVSGLHAEPSTTNISTVRSGMVSHGY